MEGKHGWWFTDEGPRTDRSGPWPRRTFQRSRWQCWTKRKRKLLVSRQRKRQEFWWKIWPEIRRTTGRNRSSGLLCVGCVAIWPMTVPKMLELLEEAEPPIQYTCNKAQVAIGVEEGTLDSVD